MSPTQMFHLPSALRRTKSAVLDTQGRQPDRRETKLHDVLGISEADINTARNQSVSSAATKFQSKSLSDATTEAGHSPPHHEQIVRIPTLHLKASSVLLHDEYDNNPGSMSSTPSGRLKNYESSSTLHSHYESQQIPLAVSQQTSDSSRRDFALRKGKPVVIKWTTPEKDSLRQAQLLKSSTARTVETSNKPGKAKPQIDYSVPAEPATPTEWRSQADQSATLKTLKSTKSMGEPPKSYRGVRFQHPPPIPSPASRMPVATSRTKNLLLEPMYPACVKLNIRRPRVGAKYWFDGHEGDSSEDDAINEPEFQDHFVLGIESAFQNDMIRAHSDISTITTAPFSSTISTDSGSTPKNRTMPTPRPTQDVPSRMATLSAKASKSNLSSFSQSQSQKSRSNPLEEVDLRNSSVLDLSSSDDEDECPTPQRLQSASSAPILRASVDMAFRNETCVEVGTAKSVDTRQTVKNLNLSRIEPLRVINRQPSQDQLRMPVPKRGSSLMVSYLSDNSEPRDRAAHLLASFPAMPVESQPPSQRTSIRSSVAFSDAGSIESRRLMSVTRQEESLLAAMRLKKAAMQYHVTQDKRQEALRNLERRSSRLSDRTIIGQRNYPSISQLSLNSRIPYCAANTTSSQHRRSLSGDDAGRSRVSATTFQTTTSCNASRMSELTFQTEISDDTRVTRLSLSSSNDSEPESRTPSILASSTTDRRESRDAYFSTDSPEHGIPGSPMGGDTRSLTINSNIAKLDELDKVPQRDEIRSQDFIDWPYNGWEARSELDLGP